MKNIFWKMITILWIFSTAGFVNAQGNRIETLVIVDETDLPILGAQVLIGDKVGSPFQGNLLVSDAKGETALPGQWKTALPVTIQKTGYVAATFLGLKPSSHRLGLRKKIEAPKPQPGSSENLTNDQLDKDKAFQLRGTTSGYRIVNGDGLIDFGIVMSTFKKRDLFNFDVSMVMSSSKDKITLVGQEVNLPSNVALPLQNEKYVFSFNFDKPQYRLLFPEGGKKSVFLARGQFELQPVIDGHFDGKELFELVNFFNIKGGSLAEANLAEKETVLDINVNQFNLTKKKIVQAPKLNNQQIMIGLSIASAADRLYPQDVKIFESEQKMQLQHHGEAAPMLLAALKNKTEMKPGPGADRVSAALIPLSEGQTPNLLPLINNPSSDSGTLVRLTVPALPQGLSAQGLYLVKSEVTERSIEGGQTEILSQPLRDIYTSEWIEKIDVPAWPDDSNLQTRLRWEVTLLAKSSGGSLPPPANPGLVKNLFEQASHATRSSLTQPAAK